jgi:uncharacterized membrane protein
VPVPHVLHRGAVPDHPGRRLEIASLLMIPAAFASFTVAELAGYALLWALGLEESDNLRQAGAPGVVAAFLLLALMLVPQFIGIALARKARRLGSDRIATTSIVLNAVIAAYVVLGGLLGLAFG